MKEKLLSVVELFVGDVYGSLCKYKTTFNKQKSIKRMWDDKRANYAGNLIVISGRLLCEQESLVQIM